jgi:hypothetical protein
VDIADRAIQVGGAQWGRPNNFVQLYPDGILPFCLNFWRLDKFSFCLLYLLQPEIDLFKLFKKL